MTVTIAWKGEYIEVLTDRSWRFYRCIRCGGELKTPTQDGYGPACKQRRPLDWRTERRKILKEDRQRYRQDHPERRI